MVRAFLDSGVLIAAARSVSPDRERALEVLSDPDFEFVTSPYVYLEVMPRAVFQRRKLEETFYDVYFRAAVFVRDLEKIYRLAVEEASRSGVGAMDALHVAAAALSEAELFITTEQPRKSVHRTSLVRVIYLFDPV